MTRSYGRAWNLLQYDRNKRGAKCYFTDDFDYEETVRKLNRLQKWFIYFGIESFIPRMIQFIKMHYIGPVIEPYMDYTYKGEKLWHIRLF